MTYLYVKALHIIFVVSWFAALFYLPRLFVYQIEALERPDQERDVLVPQLQLMARRLWFIIGWPAAVLAVIFGLWMLHLNPGLIQVAWMQWKLGFIVLLIAYHIRMHVMLKKLEAGTLSWSSKAMRLWNEGATVILFAVVFLAVVKSALGWVWGVVGIIALGVTLMLLFKAYTAYRKGKGEKV